MGPTACLRDRRDPAPPGDHEVPGPEHLERDQDRFAVVRAPEHDLEEPLPTGVGDVLEDRSLEQAAELPRERRELFGMRNMSDHPPPGRSNALWTRACRTLRSSRASASVSRDVKRSFGVGTPGIA